MITRVQSWANSQRLRLNKQVLEETQISVGDKVELTVQDDIILIAPAKQVRERHNLKELVARIPKSSTPEEVEWGTSAGLEVW